MNFVLAPDSFKESMTAKEAALSMERGISKIFPDAKCTLIPMADGGEGTVQSLVDAMDGELITVPVSDPLGRRIEASYGYIKFKKTAVIEVSSASGIHLLTKNERNPLSATSYGTGELIKNALDRGATKFIIGLGGSATNDGGAGLLQALGARLLDKHGFELPFGGGALKNLNQIDFSGFDRRVATTHFEIASDVDNPLLGKEGASYVFGKQKGATKEMIRLLDESLSNYAALVKNVTGQDVAQKEGAGAAGGLGAVFLAFFNSTMKRGVDVVLEVTEFHNKVRNADYVFTGEGSIDGQTMFGKTPIGVSKTAQSFNIPVIGFAGQVEKGANLLYEHGFIAIISILMRNADIKEVLESGSKNLEDATENVCRIIKHLE